MPSRNRKKRSKQRAEYLQKQDDILSQENKAKARARYKADPEKKKASVRDSYKADPEKKKASVRDSYKADPEKKKASVRDSYKADPEKKKASVRDSYKADPEKKKASARDSYKADPEKKKASVRDSYNADIESKQSAKRQRYQEDLEENRAAKRQKYEDNSAAIKASERNRYWNDPAVRLAKRAAERKRYRRGHRTTTTTQRTDCGTENVVAALCQMVLRHEHPDTNAGKYSFLFGNSRIESWWSQLRKSRSDWWINFFKTLVSDRLYDPYNLLQRSCCGCDLIERLPWRGSCDLDQTGCHEDHVMCLSIAGTFSVPDL
ncbi:hypothetical protein EMCRGX_G023381 [Ephydatia muelleri]